MEQRATRLFHFDTTSFSSAFEITVASQTQANGSTIVLFSANGEHMKYQCSIDDGNFSECESLYTVYM